MVSADIGHTISNMTGGRMAEHMGPVAVEPPVVGRSRLAWGAVIAGTLTALSLLALSGALAYACDVPAFRGGVYGWGAGIWSVISSAMVFLIGGATVSYLTPRGEESCGVLHGALSWVLAINIVTILSAGAFGLFHAVMPFEMMVPVGGMGMTTGAAWGIVISMAVGLACACLGGLVGYLVFGRGKTT